MKVTSSSAHEPEGTTPARPPKRTSQRVGTPPQRKRFKAYSAQQLEQIPQVHRLAADERRAMRVVASVLPFRTNRYVTDELIDWSKVPDDPVFQMTFPQRGMLDDDHFRRMATLLERSPSKAEVRALAAELRRELNPHPSGQREFNVPELDGQRLPGMQHKYTETVLFFPAQGQTCHAFCTFCFRWAQFIGDKALKFASTEAQTLKLYLQRHRRVSDVLITGGDPLVMRTRNIAAYLEALSAPELDHVQTIRIGSKALTFWPARFVYDEDADELLRCFERVVASGKHLAFMAHVNHWRELETDIARQAIRRIRDTGAVIRTQAPLLAHINDDATTWSTMWRKQVKLGMVPYFMFVERDTGAKRYFELPLAQCVEIYHEAITHVSGLARTARGPSMSAAPGKVEVQGIREIAGEKVFVLRFIQARDARWVQQPFFARFDPEATWLDSLRPAFGAEHFFFEEAYAERRGTASLE